jgi:hypothetical protein
MEKDEALEKVQKNGWNLEHLDSSHQDDFEIVLTAVKDVGKSLQYASEKLKNNKEIISAAIASDPKSIIYASLEIHYDREIALRVVSQQGMLLENFHSFKGDEEVVLTAMKQNPNAVKFLQKKLRKNLNFFLKACEISGLSMEFASTKLSENFELGMISIRQNKDSYPFLGPNLRKNKEIGMEMMNMGDYYPVLDQTLREDEEILLKAIETVKWFGPLDKAPEKFRDNIYIVRKAFQRSGHNFSAASDRIRHIFEISMEAVTLDPSAIQGVPHDIENYEEIVFTALEKDALMSQHIDQSLFLDKRFVMKSLDVNYIILVTSKSNIFRWFVNFH